MKNGVLVRVEYSTSSATWLAARRCPIRCPRTTAVSETTVQLYRSSFESMFFAYYIVFITAIKICVSPCYAHPFFLIVQITAYLTCASFCSAGSPTTLHRTVQFTLHIAICVCIVLTFRTCLAILARFAVHNMVLCFGISKIAKL